MFAHKWFRFLLGCGGLAVWLALYLVARFGRRDLRWVKTPLLIAAIPLVLAYIGLEAADRTHLAYILWLNFWGLFCAHMWLRRRERYNAPPVLTTLDLTRNPSKETVAARKQHTND